MFMTREEIADCLKEPDCTMFDQIVGNIVLAAVGKADHARLEFILNRIIGKVQDKIEVSTPKPFIITKSDGSQIICGAEPEEKDDDSV
jgi:hypothetical protein